MRGWKTNARLGLAAGLLLLPAAGAARADDGDKAPPKEKLVREMVVLIDDLGKSTILDTFGKRVSGGYLGVGLLNLTPELRTHFGVPEDAGVLLSKVAPGSPAEK